MCGIVGISGQQPVAIELYDSLIHLQHRGQDAAGILTAGERFQSRQGKGLVREVFSPDDLQELTGHAGIGHLRYPTAGDHGLAEVQPFWTGSPYGVALAHNGQLVNHLELAKTLMSQHRHLNSSSDSEVILCLLADALATMPEPNDEANFFDLLCGVMKGLFKQLNGAYSVVGLIIGRGLIAFRDPQGVRPLVVGERQAANGCKEYIFASEPTMFYPLGFTQVGDLAAGELAFVSSDSVKLYRSIVEHKKMRPCVFEYVYFSRPDAKINDISVYRARLRMGQNLAQQWREKYPDDLPDIVIPAPFTANTAALSFASELGVRYSEGLYKNPFIGRTFIMPTMAQRKKSVRYKLIPQETEIRDKCVLILDDSIVRGTTSREIVQMVREFGAKVVYFASASPPIKFPCFYGIDIPTRKELIAAYSSVEEIKKYLTVDKLLYQSIENLVEATTRKGDNEIDATCLACMNGCYPTGGINLGDEA
ncbi:MAG: amidophosphoribosyltransferase [Gammaproteobacteria bacterium]|nr:amidophosphoribosyltransferase [Gammaproteobacteria bacterium]